jgi:uncharacterized protein (DUF697 family)/predicted GTPase
MSPSDPPPLPQDSDAPLDVGQSAEGKLPKWRSLLQKTTEPVQTAVQEIGKSFQAGSSWVGQWFGIGEAELQELLEQVRQSLPTTEVILVGKAQTGKSSIIRALTGASVDIIGQGFRPHTAHTQQYAYPTNDLPLLNFIDTVGLGEGLKDPGLVQNELQGLLSAPTPDPSAEKQQVAQIIVVTLRITDFAVDAVRHLLQDLRQSYPHIPCLIAITCLHELYPERVWDHPDYPPMFWEVQRAVQALQEQFDFADRTVLVDFTLEEDSFTPVLYGLEAFVEALAALLPAAEAQAIYQLLEQVGVDDRIGNLYRDAGRRYILPFSVMAATLAAVPLPFTTMPVLTALQVALVTLLGRLYGQTISPAQAGGIMSAIAGGFGAQMLGRELVKFIPGFGSVVAASWAGAYTWALGEGACVYFGDLMGGKKPDPQKIQQAMKEAFQDAQERFKRSVQPRPSSR